MDHLFLIALKQNHTKQNRVQPALSIFKLLNEELHDCTAQEILSGDQIREDELGGAHGRETRTGFFLGHLKRPPERPRHR
jgi:hypothetical protein